MYNRADENKKKEKINWDFEKEERPGTKKRESQIQTEGI